MENLQDMNKIEQCAEEIVDYLSPYTRITEFGKINHIKRLCEMLTKHFPQPPASTPSLDEVVAKASQSFVWDSTKLGDAIKQAILEYNASLVAENKTLRGMVEVGTKALIERDYIRAQLATAEQTGYERGVKASASLLATSNEPLTKASIRLKWNKAILNLLNKKGTE